MEITEIPGLMDKLNWTNGATLMRRWFDAKSATAPAYGPPDTTTVTMDWVLGFTRAKNAYDEIISEKLWETEKSKVALAERLRANGYLTTKKLSFCDFHHPVPGLKKWSFNYRTVKTELQLNRDLDGLDAALGNFTFYLVASGDVGPVTLGKTLYRVDVKKIGIFIRDSYDFNDAKFNKKDPRTYISQQLGCWSPPPPPPPIFGSDSTDRSELKCQKIEVSDIVTRTPRARATCVSNKMFRNWRDEKKRGGDFEVYSGIKKIGLFEGMSLEFDSKDIN